MQLLSSLVKDVVGHRMTLCALCDPYTASWMTVSTQGEAQREVVRVTVECCLQERAWNGYYAQLLSSLVKNMKGHRMTLQFCLWDLIKAVCIPLLF